MRANYTLRHRSGALASITVLMAAFVPVNVLGQAQKQKQPSATPPTSVKPGPVKKTSPPPAQVPEGDPADSKPIPRPAPKNGEDTLIAGVDCAVWKPKTPGPWPLVIFSHGFHGSARQATFLTVALADHGYLVIAPNHRDAYKFGVPNAGLRSPQASFANTRNWNSTTYKDRADDIHRLVAGLKQSDTYKKSIDWAHVAIIGHSLGGYTALGLAGAVKGWYLADFKAVIAFAPYTAPLLQGKVLSNISVPVMYQGGTLDFGISPAIRSKGGALDQTPAPDYYVEFSRAGHFAWTDINPAFQPEIIAYTEQFLDKYLKSEQNIDLTKQSKSVSLLRYKDKTAAAPPKAPAKATR